MPYSHVPYPHVVLNPFSGFGKSSVSGGHMENFTCIPWPVGHTGCLTYRSEQLQKSERYFTFYFYLHEEREYACTVKYGLPNIERTRDASIP